MDSPTGIVQSLAEHVTPLGAPNPEAEPSDLAPVTDAAVVGLGEATHGTQEFFRFKHRLIRYLIVEEGLRLVALESNFSETPVINEYVTEGVGDPLDALDGIYFWTWNTEEVLALIEWLREFNSDRPRDDQVNFYGIDMQFTPGPARALIDYLGTVDSEFRAANVDTLKMLADRRVNDDQHRDERLADAERFTSALGARLDEREAEYTAATSRKAYELAVQHHRTLNQAVESKRASHDDGQTARLRIRDEAMAENASWILDHEPHDTVAIWAHNGHVRRGTADADDGTEHRLMGDHTWRRSLATTTPPSASTSARGAFERFRGKTTTRMESASSG